MDNLWIMFAVSFAAYVIYLVLSFKSESKGSPLKYLPFSAFLVAPIFGIVQGQIPQSLISIVVILVTLASFMAAHRIRAHSRARSMLSDADKVIETADAIAEYRGKIKKPYD